jgi:hypothetical protein
MLEHTAPIVETGGFEGRLIGMLHDSNENINWRAIQKTPRNPNYRPEAIYAHDMPPLPAGNYKLILEVGHKQWFYFPQILCSNSQWFYSIMQVMTQVGHSTTGCWGPEDGTLIEINMEFR